MDLAVLSARSRSEDARESREKKEGRVGLARDTARG